MPPKQLPSSWLALTSAAGFSALQQALVAAWLIPPLCFLTQRAVVCAIYLNSPLLSVQ